MFIYIVALGLIISGASSATILGLQTLVRERKISSYDAKGYLVIAVVVLAFLVASLAYFWGISRFGALGTAEEGAHGAVIGILFTVCGSIGALGYGLTRIRPPRHLN